MEISAVRILLYCELRICNAPLSTADKRSSVSSERPLRNDGYSLKHFPSDAECLRHCINFAGCHHFNIGHLKENRGKPQWSHGAMWEKFILGISYFDHNRLC